MRIAVCPLLENLSVIDDEAVLVPTRRESGCGGGRLDFADGAGHGGAEVFGGGEGLADLGGQATPFGDGQRGGDASQRDLHDDVIAADDEQHAQGGVVACLVAQV